MQIQYHRAFDRLGRAINPSSIVVGEVVDPLRSNWTSPALAARCDIVLENFKVGMLKQFGLDYESIKAIDPQIIYCSITGFGQIGPKRDAPLTSS